MLWCMRWVPLFWVFFFCFFSDKLTSEINENMRFNLCQLLDEMLDNGFPLATESNILQELIKPPNILRTIANTVTGRSKWVIGEFVSNIDWHSLYNTLLNSRSVSHTLPTGQLSSIPWRRTGVKYANNEAYFDVVEEVDAIIDKSGSTVFAEIQGYVSWSKCSC